MESSWRLNVARYGLTGYYAGSLAEQANPLIAARFLFSGVTYLLLNRERSDPTDALAFRLTAGEINNYVTDAVAFIRHASRFPYGYPVEAD